MRENVRKSPNDDDGLREGGEHLEGGVWQGGLLYLGPYPYYARLFSFISFAGFHCMVAWRWKLSREGEQNERETLLLLLCLYNSSAICIARLCRSLHRDSRASNSPHSPTNVGLRNLDCIAIEKVVCVSLSLSLLVPLSLSLSTHMETWARAPVHTPPPAHLCVEPPIDRYLPFPFFSTNNKKKKKEKQKINSFYFPYTQKSSSNLYNYFIIPSSYRLCVVFKSILERMVLG